jgi:hypothetical protein
MEEDLSLNSIEYDNNPINDITMQFLMNKDNKYLLKKDPEQNLEKNKYKNDLLDLKGEIMTITEELINNYEDIINNDVNESFQIYTKSIIKYLNHKKIESLNKYNDLNNDECNSDEYNSDEYNSDTNTNQFSNISSKSYWGSNILKRL